MGCAKARYSAARFVGERRDICPANWTSQPQKAGLIRTLTVAIHFFAEGDYLDAFAKFVIHYADELAVKFQHYILWLTAEHFEGRFGVAATSSRSAMAISLQSSSMILTPSMRSTR